MSVIYESNDSKTMNRIVKYEKVTEIVVIYE